MRLAEKRPAAFVCGVFAVTSFISVYFFRFPLFYIFISCIVTALLVLAFADKDEDKRKKRIIILLIVFALLIPIGNTCINEFYKIPRIRELSDSDPACIKGVVVSSFSEDDHVKYIVEADEISGKTADFRILVEKFGNISSFDTGFLPGDVISCEAVITPIDADNGYWYSFCADGIYLSAEPESMKLLENGEDTLYRLIFNMAEASKRYSERLKNSVIVKAILFGDRSSVSDGFKENINNAGLSHYLAVSGLHISLVIGGIFAFLKLFGVHRRVNSFISILLCIAYMAICGFSPSVVRAGSMLVLYNISVILRRDADAPTSLCVVSFLMIVIDPECIYDIGFKLSFASALGIIVGAVPYNKYIGERAFFNSENTFVRILTAFLLALIRALGTTVAAVVFSFPFLLTEFRYINILSPVYNLIISVIFIPMMYLTLGSVSFYAASDMFTFARNVLETIADLLGNAADMMIDVFEYFIDIFGSFSDSVMYARSSVTIFSAVVFLAVTIVFAIKRVHVRFYPVIPLSVVLAVILSSGMFYFAANERLSVYSVSDRTDEKLIMRYKNDIIMGELATKGYYTSKHALENVIYDNGITSVDGYFISHYSDKLYDQIRMISKMISIKKIYLPYPSDEREKDIFLEVFDLCSEEGTELERFSFGRSTVCQSFEVTFEKLNGKDSDKVTGYEMNVTAGNKAELLYTSCRKCFEGLHKDAGDVLIHLNCSPADDLKYSKKFYSGDIVKNDVYDESLTYVTGSVGHFGFHVYKNIDKDNYPRLNVVSEN